MAHPTCHWPKAENAGGPGAEPLVRMRASAVFRAPLPAGWHARGDSCMMRGELYSEPGTVPHYS